MNHLEIINQEIQNHRKALETIDNKFKRKIISISKALSKALKKVGTIYWCGNGGSASDSMHLSTELIGRFKKIENRSSQYLFLQMLHAHVFPMILVLKIYFLDRLKP